MYDNNSNDCYGIQQVGQLVLQTEDVLEMSFSATVANAFHLNGSVITYLIVPTTVMKTTVNHPWVSVTII